jgi:hypothetical protein
MKTSVIMQRDLNGVKVRQDSKTMFFNANDLLDLYNTTTGSNKRLQDYLDNQNTEETKMAVLKEIQNNANQREFENGVIQTKRGKNGGTWMHPYLFIDFGMWLSADFKVTVIKWFYDNLIQLRNDAGDSFKDVNKALFEKYPNKAQFLYSNEATMINKLVFGTTEAGQRNLATEQQLALLKALQKADIHLIEQGLDYYERYEKLKEYRSNFLLMTQ